MVTKLSFKGDKKRSKKVSSKSCKKSVNPIKSPINNISDTKDSFFYINGEKKFTSDIDASKLNVGWTHLFPKELSFSSYEATEYDEDRSKFPIIITFSDSEKERFLILQECKYEEEGLVKTKLMFTSDSMEYSNIEDTVIFTESEVNNNDKMNRIEPTSVSQVFILSDVTDIFRDSTKYLSNNANTTSRRNKLYSMKTCDGLYLTCDPVRNNLKLANTLTENSIFQLIFDESSVYPYVRIINGKAEEELKTVVVTTSNELKVIPDPEDLLSDMSRFIIRLKCEDSVNTKKILDFKNTEQETVTENIDGLVKSTILKLSSMGFKINDKTVHEIIDAKNSGKLNQWIVEFKEKNLNDRRA